MITSTYPVLMSSDVAATAGWFVRLFGFDTVFESEWYVSLRSGEHELAILQIGHETIPAGYSAPAAGVLVNIEVDDVDLEHQRLSAKDETRLALDIRSEVFGQRHFIVIAPGDILVDVIQPIPMVDAVP